MPSPPALLIAVAVLLVLLVPGAAAAASPTTCTLTGKQQRSFGPTYVTAIRVTATGCATGRRVVKAFHGCRQAAGGVKGRCRKPVLGFRCTETRGGIATQFSGRVSCRRGKAIVLHTYTQFT